MQPVEIGDGSLSLDTDEESNDVCTVENKRSAKILAEREILGS